MAEKHSVRLRVNGVTHEAAVEPRLTLVDLLRGELGLGGVHVGCEHGVCGACTVLIDGQPHDRASCWPYRRTARR